MSIRRQEAIAERALKSCWGLIPALERDVPHKALSLRYSRNDERGTGYYFQLWAFIVWPAWAFVILLTAWSLPVWLIRLMLWLGSLTFPYPRWVTLALWYILIAITILIGILLVLLFTTRLWRKVSIPFRHFFIRERAGEPAVTSEPPPSVQDGTAGPVLRSEAQSWLLTGRLGRTAKAILALILSGVTLCVAAVVGVLYGFGHAWPLFLLQIPILSYMAVVWFRRGA